MVDHLHPSGRKTVSYDKIGTIQRRLAWPLRKDDTHKSRTYHFFLYMYIHLCLPTGTKSIDNGEIRTHAGKAHQLSRLTP